MSAYSNGCPRVGWCIECERVVALRADGVLVPHCPSKGRKKWCHSEWISLQERASMLVMPLPPGGVQPGKVTVTDDDLRDAFKGDR